MAKPDGGPAFPRPLSANREAQVGMTLRDYFAAAAIDSASEIVSYKPGETYNKRLAGVAYEIADAMLAEREG